MMNTLASLFDRCRQENQQPGAFPATGDLCREDAPIDSGEVLNPLEHEDPAAGPAIEDFMQWYERWPDRFETERVAFEERGFRVDLLRDGRVCFSKEPESSTIERIAVLCDWIYPLRPPSVFVEDVCEITDRIPKNEDGSLNVFTTSKVWQPAMAAVTIVDYYEEIKEVLAEVNEAAAEPKHIEAVATTPSPE